MASSLICKEATTRADIDAIAEMLWKAYATPYRPFFSALNPIFGPSASDRAMAIAASKEKYWRSMHLNLNDGTSNHWIMIIEPETGKVVAGGQWGFHLKNPYPDGYVPEKIVARTWPPDTLERDFVTELMRQLYKPRQTWMQRPVAIILIYPQIAPASFGY